MLGVSGREECTHVVNERHGVNRTSLDERAVKDLAEVVVFLGVTGFLEVPLERGVKDGELCVQSVEVGRERLNRVCQLVEFTKLLTLPELADAERRRTALFAATDVLHKLVDKVALGSVITIKHTHRDVLYGVKAESVGASLVENPLAPLVHVLNDLGVLVVDCR